MITLGVDVTSTKPDFVNEQGVKWWVDQLSTKYAYRCGEQRNVSLKHIVVFITEELNGRLSYVVINAMDQSILKATSSLEDVGVWLDIYAMKLESTEEENVATA